MRPAARDSRPDAIQAEIWAKALFLAGSHAAAAEADEQSLPCVLVARSGSTRPWEASDEGADVLLLARASGFTAYLLITASMIAACPSSRDPSVPPSRPRSHSTCTASSRRLRLAAVGVHGLTLVADATVAITLETS